MGDQKLSKLTKEEILAWLEKDLAKGRRVFPINKFLCDIVRNNFPTYESQKLLLELIRGGKLTRIEPPETTKTPGSIWILGNKPPKPYAMLDELKSIIHVGAKFTLEKFVEIFKQLYKGIRDWSTQDVYEVYIKPLIQHTIITPVQTKGKKLYYQLRNPKPSRIAIDTRTLKRLEEAILGEEFGVPQFA